MKVGSLVVCINNSNLSGKNVSIPIKDEVYTIRDVVDVPEKGIGIRLQEIINPELHYKTRKGVILFECAFSIERFVEIQTLQESDSFINELMADAENVK